MNTLFLRRILLLTALAACLLPSTAAARSEAPAKKVKAPAVAASSEVVGAPGRTERASKCDLAALGETIEILRTSEPMAARVQLEAIRLANGRCMRFVLAAARSSEVRKFCAAPETITAVQAARELRRRIAALEADELLGSSAAGKECRAAYQLELKTTRVVMRAKT
jgi:hypothetical protein